MPHDLPNPTNHIPVWGAHLVRLGHPTTLWGGRGDRDLSHHGDMGIPNTGTFHATGEASPVGKYHQREVFPVEVPNSLGCFKSRVWEPDLSSLLDYLEKTVSS